jgi:hypothetical protein
MKIIILLISCTFALMAGGDILPVEPMTKFEKMDNDWISNVDQKIEEDITKGEGCIPGALASAELLPYSGEDIPDAQTMSYSGPVDC